MCSYINHMHSILQTCCPILQCKNGKNIISCLVPNEHLMIQSLTSLKLRLLSGEFEGSRITIRARGICISARCWSRPWVRHTWTIHTGPTTRCQLELKGYLTGFHRMRCLLPTHNIHCRIVQHWRFIRVICGRTSMNLLASLVGFRKAQSPISRRLVYDSSEYLYKHAIFWSTLKTFFRGFPVIPRGSFRHGSVSIFQFVKLKGGQTVAR